MTPSNAFLSIETNQETKDMKRTTKIVTGAAVVALGIAAAGIAAAHGDGERKHGYGGNHGYAERGGKSHSKARMHAHFREHMMERFDADSDGQITAAELTAKREKALADHDADKDGKLSLKEYEGLWLEMMRHKMVRHFQRLDRDGDAVVTAEDLQRPLDRILSRMDRNEDGVISKDDRRHKGWRHHRNGDDDDKPSGSKMKNKAQ